MGWGIQRYLFGGENVRYINALAFLSGQVGIGGGGVYFNVSSGRNINTDWADRGGRPCRTLLLPRIGQEILDADPPIRFLLADGTNIVNQAPDSQTIERALETVDFKVVVDAFMTDTASLADVILPCALDHEREEIVGSCFHNMINYSRALFAPAGEARSDFHIMADLAHRLGMDFPQREEILAGCLNTPFVDSARGHGPPMERLKQTGFLETCHPGIAWKDLVFAHPDGKYRLPAKLNPDPPSPRGFPLHLLSLVNRDFIHSQIPEAAQKGLPRVWINPESPAMAGVDPSEPVFLATCLGRMAVSLCFARNLHPLTLIIRRGGWIKHGRCVNPLIESRVTDMGENAAYYSQYARVEN
jgi:anaerobic selenocysteine-containing dehydrogenase